MPCNCQKSYGLPLVTDMSTYVRLVRELVRRGRDSEQALRDVAHAYGLTKQQLMQIKELL